METKKVYVTVSDIALCQRCPALLAYKIHRGIKSAWRVGIQGGSDFYGSIFHKHIAKTFFEAAASPRNILHSQLIQVVTGGFKALNDFIRERIFMPFIANNAKSLTSGQIISMASGVEVWTMAMSKFFREITSLTIMPRKNLEQIFIKPEQKLQAEYIFDDLDSLVITGCYDALLFNPDKAEARLFEFKGYNKSDIAVPLSQSLVYSWLIERSTGITPSVEIIYLDERSREPDVFDSRTVSEMMKSGLKNLFASVFNVISLKKFPAVNTSKKLCSVCKFSGHCKKDVASGFSVKHKGISLLSVIIFMAFAFMVMSQVFFYSVNSNESVIEEREIMRVRLLLQDMIRQANTSANLAIAHSKNKDKVNYKTFWDDSPKNFHQIKNNNATVDIHNLNYTFESGFDKNEWDKLPAYKRIFDQMGENYYLIRAYAPVTNDRNLMIQAVVYASGTEKKIISWQEVWY